MAGRGHSTRSCELKVENRAPTNPLDRQLPWRTSVDWVQFIGQEQDRHEGERALVVASCRAFSAHSLSWKAGRRKYVLLLTRSMLIMLLSPDWFHKEFCVLRDESDNPNFFSHYQHGRVPRGCFSNFMGWLVRLTNDSCYLLALAATYFGLPYAIDLLPRMTGLASHGALLF